MSPTPNSKNCIIIHGCPESEESFMDFKSQTYHKHWIPWTKQQLTARGVSTETPYMPDPWAPDYEKYKKEFEKYSVNENTILVGHSCGSAFLVRWLGETQQRVAKLILVAPWKIPDEDDGFRKAFYNHTIDPTIRDRVGEIIMFTADNEEDDGKKSLQLFHEALGGHIINLPDHGHYILEHMRTEEFPELIKNILE